MPPVVSQVTNVLDHSLEAVKDKIMHTGGEHKPGGGGPPPPPANGAATNGQVSKGQPSIKAEKPKVRPITVAVVLVALGGYFYFMYRFLRWRDLDSIPKETPLLAGTEPKALDPALANGQAVPEGEANPQHPPEQSAR
jgi:hypothetical protein